MVVLRAIHALTICMYIFLFFIFRLFLSLRLGSPVVIYKISLASVGVLIFMNYARWLECVLIFILSITYLSRY